ncbi:outer membrane protein assembly factor BamE domain-containing protein [Litoribrevibacter albus]|uniref:Outer membrane protein assembly factor BamE domain-containing protein n=1 Tax=Litoribrevibacter albus TaxID=1473156 RepID=A0AA37SBM1_9GAMM|nr:outer membrane protein assembly factor BamE [Litoribrevibacter albus]GLQ31593.1 hypothetical protein GCM10007876_20720 [Litoribrevibacter albus]
MLLTVRSISKGFMLVLMAAWLSACATVGKEFTENNIQQIEINKTTKVDVKQMFGSPWRVGSESGQTTWTYGLYKYSAFKPAATKDLVIRFNSNGTVAGYTFNTTQHKE